MQFSEPELTAAMQGYAKATLVAQSKDLRKGRGDIEQVWRDLGGMARYQLLDGLSDQVLPVLASLPEVERVHGESLRFRAADVRAAVEENTGDVGGMLKRKAIVIARATLIGAALESLPPWFDPDKISAVPDSPEGLTP